MNHLTESERALLSSALEIARDKYLANAQTLDAETPRMPRLAWQFRLQANEARVLLDKLAAADVVMLGTESGARA